MAKPRDKQQEAVEILRIEKAVATFFVLGTTPLYMNRMPKKAREYLLWPPRRQNRAALEAVQKHDPPAEYRDSIYRCREQNAPTLCHLPNNSFKKAMASAALDIPGASKAQVGRLVSVLNPTVFLWGRPFLDMKVVIQAGMSRAPDIRTRAIFPEWACKVDVAFIPRLIAEKDVLNLFAAAGMICGVGDGRPQKGSSDFGQWELVGKDDKRWHDIVNRQGRKMQQEAMNNPTGYDEETEELLSWYHTEVIRRGTTVSQPKTEMDRWAKTRRAPDTPPRPAEIAENVARRKRGGNATQTA
jgi:hypothetical protein